MRSKTLLLGSTAVVLTCALVGGGTYALFTAQTGSVSNTFSAGTVSIANSNKTVWSAGYANMAPGDTLSKQVTVSNTGSLALEFVTVPAKSGALFEGTGKASVAVSNGTATLAPSSTQDVTASVSLPLSASNSYQSANGDLSLTFHAWQTAHVTSKTATFTQAGTVGTWDSYTLHDGATLIPLNQSGIIAFTEHRPNGSTLSFEVDGSDPNFYFNNTRPTGNYSYEIMTPGGIKYTATIVRP